MKGPGCGHGADEYRGRSLLCLPEVSQAMPAAVRMTLSIELEQDDDGRPEHVHASLLEHHAIPVRRRHLSAEPLRLTHVDGLNSQTLR
jgi:hypothetical protein